MNYRHAYHAGAIADVVKHVVLTLLLDKLCAKATPFCVLDTHAGIGRYDLNGECAQRTLEADGGIHRLLSAQGVPEALGGYLRAVRAFNGPDTGRVRWYPGSPRLARAWMRPGDRLILAELHPEDATTLAREFKDDAQVAVHHMDGYATIKAHLPPREHRGLVLIDSPFEEPGEFDRLVQALILGHARWPTGIFALWFPLKERPAIWRFYAALEATAIPRLLTVELTFTDEADPTRLNGCGLIIAGAPWQLDQTLSRTLPALHHILTQGASGAGGTRVEWLIPPV